MHSLIQIEGCRSYVSSLTTVFQISTGSWDWDSIYEGGPVAIVHFIIFVVIGTIILLNLLIAVRLALHTHRVNTVYQFRANHRCTDAR